MHIKQYVIYTLVILLELYDIIYKQKILIPYMIFKYLTLYIFFKKEIRPRHICLFSSIEHFNYQNAIITSLIIEAKIFY